MSPSESRRRATEDHDEPAAIAVETEEDSDSPDQRDVPAPPTAEAPLDAATLEGLRELHAKQFEGLDEVQANAALRAPGRRRHSYRLARDLTAACRRWP